MTSPLTLLMPVLPGTSVLSIVTTLASHQQKVHAALNLIGTVHYFRFLILDRSRADLQPDLLSILPSDSLVIGIITEFDGDFSVYIQDFVAQLGDEFDAVLSHVIGGAALSPVVNNVTAFEAFIAEHNASQHLPNNNLYAAYPQTVQEILAAV